MIVRTKKGYSGPGKFPPKFAQQFALKSGVPKHVVSKLHGSALLRPFALFCGLAFALSCPHVGVSASDRVSNDRVCESQKIPTSKRHNSHRIRSAGCQGQGSPTLPAVQGFCKAGSCVAQTWAGHLTNTEHKSPSLLTTKFRPRAHAPQILKSHFSVTSYRSAYF